MLHPKTVVAAQNQWKLPPVIAPRRPSIASSTAPATWRQNLTVAHEEDVGRMEGGGVLGKTVDATDCCGKPISHHEEFSSRDCTEETLDRILDRARDAEAKNDFSAQGGC